MAAFFPLLQQLSRKELDRIQNSSSYGQQSDKESQMFLSQMNEEMEEAQVFARCGVLLSSNERKREARMSHEMALGGYLDIGTGMILC